VNPRLKEMLGPIAFIFLLMGLSAACDLLRQAVWERYLMLAFMLGLSEVLGLMTVAFLLRWVWMGFRRDAESVRKFFSQ